MFCVSKLSSQREVKLQEILRVLVHPHPTYQDQSISVAVTLGRCMSDVFLKSPGESLRDVGGARACARLEPGALSHCRSRQVRCSVF